MSEHAEQRHEPRAVRVRRPADLSLAILAIGVVAVLFAIARGLPIGTAELTDDVSSWLTHHVPRVLALFVASIVELGCLALIFVAMVSLLRSARRDAGNALVAGVAAVGIALGCVVDWHARSTGVSIAMLRGTNASELIAAVGLIAFLTGTDLVRRPRWKRWCLAAVAALLVSELALVDLTFFAMLVAPLMGWSIGLFVRWGLRAASVRPTAEALAAWLERSGVAVVMLNGRDDRGALEGTLEDGTRASVLLANRDNRGSGIARRLWRSLRLRGVAIGTQALSSRSQLENHALSSYSAAHVGVMAPRVLILAEFPPETLVLALACPSGAPLDERVAPSELVGLFSALRALHQAGVAHRDLRAENLVIGADAVGFASIERAQTGAGELVRRLDVAQLLTTLARVAGAPQAIKAFREGYPVADEREVVAVLQPVALAPWGWSGMRAAKSCLDEVRHELVGSGDVAAPLRLERFRWRTVISTVALTVAAFLLIGQFSKVDLLGALREMNPGWFLLAVLGSAITYLGAAANLAAFVPKRLSILRGFAVQLSSAFVGVAMPPTVGHVAVNSRYLHRAGVDEGAIAAAIAVSQIVNVVSTVLILLVIGLLTGSGVSHFKIVPGTDLLLGVGATALMFGILMAIPRTRSLILGYIWPHVRTAIPRLLEAISQPLRLAAGIGGNLLLIVGYVGALLAALYALGAHPPILAAAAVYLAGNAVGSIAPTPGGLGAVEAVLSAGLTAIGIPAHEAVPAVLVFRIATFWLPIPAGWLAFSLLQRTGTL